ncbi:MAG: p-cresol methylhydroxylase [SAR86 cluster bacterium]|uniref:p-cresol methylhydroxylase n=1 Tax=SAR86 cluster bacterium TaxID=2030880 RepID=A0A2A5CCF0_9GAMM|nr:MAG: p-cresol methylhydroxylase [SAR86 cluster bacterium]
MNKLTILCFFLTSFVATTVQAQDLSPEQASGKVVFDKWCEPCHGRVAGGLFGGLGANALPGTSALGVKYKGDLPAVLEDRTDLVPIYISTVVRNGLYGMPISRKTEVSDTDLDNIIAYLTRPH